MPRNFFTFLLFGSLAISSPAFAGDKANANNMWRLFQGAPKIKNNKGDFWKLRGRMFWDYADLQEEFVGGSRIDISDNEFRAVRIGVEGKYSDFKYKAEVDFAGGVSEIKDLHIVWKGPVDIAIGQMKAGITMEEENSARFTTFIERAMITDAIGFDRRIGVQFAKTGANYGIMGGVFGNSVNGAIDGKPSNRLFTARAHFAPVLQKDRLLHLGAGLRHTERELGGPKHSSRWGPHLAKQKIKPKPGDNALLSSAEMAMKFGAFHAQAEYISENGDLGEVKGGFLQAGYFITGENRVYKISPGKFARTKPVNPISKGGLGAFEIAARFDSLDARKAGDEKIDNYSVGINWYPESHLRLAINYTNANSETFNAKGIYTRLYIDW